MLRIVSFFTHDHPRDDFSVIEVI
ncbi:unnamed protein product [Leptidea sinapis]|uniref:Uncharacterized protein n=1 Tax=Leptidea sinapis TaxID=189913 RepID=A0A5E4Q157_9NEOP|nr:unnamed protein product [Leptidea sinapis]